VGPGYSLQTSATATAAARAGDIGSYIGGIQTGGSQGGVDTWMLLALAGLAVLLLKR
jgi:hypothetical protein